MTTPNDIINLALKKIGVLGVGQTALAEDINDGLTELNQMIAQWAQRRYMLYHLVTSSVACDGSTTYSIGPTGDINISERPTTIESAFARQTTNASPNQVDYPLKPIPSRENYNQIAIKQLAAFPSWLFYDADYPLGYLYPYPIPNNQYSLFVTYRMLLSQFSSLTTTITLPPIYEQALTYNLAGLLATSYNVDVPAAVAAIARSSMATIRANNAQIPNAAMPQGLVRGQFYNVFSDQTY